MAEVKLDTLAQVSNGNIQMRRLCFGQVEAEAKLRPNCESESEKWRRKGKAEEEEEEEEEAELNQTQAPTNCQRESSPKLRVNSNSQLTT